MEVKINASSSDIGGVDIARVVSAANNNATNVKAAGGRVYGWQITNTNGAARFVKLYNKATAPAPATDTPVMTIQIPATSVVALSFLQGISFATGIGYAIVVNAADNDNTSVGAGDVILQLLYR